MLLIDSLKVNKWEKVKLNLINSVHSEFGIDGNLNKEASHLIVFNE
jgi:hypothetical protein